MFQSLSILWPDRNCSLDGFSIHIQGGFLSPVLIKLGIHHLSVISVFKYDVDIDRSGEEIRHRDWLSGDSSLQYEHQLLRWRLFVWLRQVDGIAMAAREVRKACEGGFHANFNAKTKPVRLRQGGRGWSLDDML